MRTHGKLWQAIVAYTTDAHLSTSYDDLDPSVLDKVWPEQRFEALLEALSECQGVSVEADARDWEGERGIRVYVNLASTPSWSTLHHQMHGDAKVRLLLGAHEALIYLVGQLSRVGPFWREYWNSYGVHEGRMVPRLIPPPVSSSRWHEAAEALRRTRSAFGVWDVPDDLLSRPLTHLWVRRGDVNGPRHPTVYEALFGG